MHAQTTDAGSVGHECICDRTQSDMNSSRERILDAFSAARWREYSARLTELLGEHLERVTGRRSPVLNWNEPAPNIAAATRTLLEGGDATGEERFAQLVRQILARGQNLHHPRYIGHQVPASVPIAALFDFIGAVTNQVMAIYEMGPWASAVERSLVEQLGVRFGLPAGSFAGLITHGGTLANLTALLTARNLALPGVWEEGVPRSGPEPALVVQGDAHYGIARSAGILGLGTRHVVRVPLDDRRRMSPAALAQVLTDLQAAGRPVIAVVACACATPIGAFDELPRIADVCEQHGVWLHVDAAHGGGAIFSARYRHLLNGLDRADSFICDAHKTLFVPALCAFVFYRNRDHRFEAFQQEAPYLFDPTTPLGTAEYDSGLLTLECTKRAAGFGLWGLWSLCGEQLFADMVDSTFGLAREFWELLQSTRDFRVLHEPECNIVCFRYLPDEMQSAPLAEVGRFNQAIRRRLMESGEFYIVQTTLDGAAALRVTIMNPLTTLDDSRELLESIRRVGRDITQESYRTV
jgi:L-2,4-diaminobutyrate decarboxylase